MGRGTWYMGHGVEPWGGDVPRRLSKSQKLPKRIGCRSARLRHGPPCPRPVPESRRGQRQRAGQRADAGRRTRRKWTRLGLGGATGDARPRARRRGGESRPSAQGSPHLSAPLSAAQQQRLAAWPGVSQRVPARPSVCQRVPACASRAQQRVPPFPS
jgi:hypothetical protein